VRIRNLGGRALGLAPILALSCWPTADAKAQARYDEHEITDRIFVSLGGFNTPNYQSSLRVDPQGIGIGTIIDLEDDLNLEDSLSILRLDGHFRFSRAHRLEWTYFDQERSGSTTLVDRDIQIGDVTFPINYRVDSEWEFEVLKVSYAYSFINTAKYEFYLGGGINIRNISVGFTGVGSFFGSTDTRVFDDDGRLPLPTLTAGMQYNVTDKLGVRFRTESFFVQVNDAEGRWQDTYALLDYRITDKFGVGGGLNFFNIRMSADLDRGYNVEAESSYTGFLLYVSARF
jgi:hypothetical protein